jgi:hypothetical protein
MQQIANRAAASDHPGVVGADGEIGMTTILIAWREAIISWVNISLVPIEVVYDAIESELERREAKAAHCRKPSR